MQKQVAEGNGGKEVKDVYGSKALTDIVLTMSCPHRGQNTHLTLSTTVSNCSLVQHKISPKQAFEDSGLGIKAQVSGRPLPLFHKLLLEELCLPVNP
jgi:hypothetical protein